MYNVCCLPVVVVERTTLQTSLNLTLTHNLQIGECHRNRYVTIVCHCQQTVFVRPLSLSRTRRMRQLIIITRRTLSVASTADAAIVRVVMN